MTPPVTKAARLPDVAPGHWDTDEGRVMAQIYIDYARTDLPHGDMSDLALANRLFMADRSDLDLLAWQMAAQKRIRWLSAQLALATAIRATVGEVGNG